ncbi:hypothetical protein NPIL_467221 [Nephila pilipes]|uniref:Uncharacterized protein n=1 Tax=Nephila pilipes TaxID=299642 RepID=A0A8X6MEK1_NEPPI|nr:hypothetical protein NPIL_467221 [Nephila pilipes]
MRITDLDELDSSSTNRRLVYRQKLKQDLQRRSEYLGQLRRNYHHVKDKNIEVGEVVLVSIDIVWSGSWLKCWNSTKLEIDISELLR